MEGYISRRLDVYKLGNKYVEERHADEHTHNDR